MQSAKLPLYISIFLFIAFGYSQNSAVYTNNLKDYQEALTLYNNKQYAVAQNLFSKVKRNTSDIVVASNCEYYIATTAIRLNQRNADELIESFVENNPTSTKKNSAYLDVANYYFRNGKYARARKWFPQINTRGLSAKERERYNFNYGYTLYATDNKKEAEKYLTKVVSSEKYGSQAKYYLGYLAYEGDDYDSANSYFDEVGGNEKYKEKLSYFKADLNFKLGKFNEAIALAQQQLEKSNKRERSELSKIIGESYFNLKEYDKALPFLKAYEGRKGKWNNTDYYQLGYVYYQQKDYENAISEFNRIIDGDNAVAQNAYYHLGESYINLNKKSEALNAFKNASEMSFDGKIKKDAWFNYAKLSYEIGNPYTSVPQVLTSYIKAYPDSEYNTEIETLLIDSYITSKNYKEALELLKGKNSFEHKEAFQKVAFLRGIELYNDSNYKEALYYFETSLKSPVNSKFVAKATFWKAESQFNVSDYNESLITFKSFNLLDEAKSLDVFKHLNYSLGYNYFKLKNYEKAKIHFQDYVNNNNPDITRLNDAYLRLGDVNFVSTAYKEAINYYKKAIKIKQLETDYAAFQVAMSQGYLGKTKQKISELNKFINTYKSSPLRDDAMFALGNTYIKNNDSENAFSIYNKLLLNYPKSIFTPKVLLRQGLAYYNQNENRKALKKFKKVAQDFPASGEAVQAVSTARLIYIDLGEVDVYANWVRTLDYVEVSDVELDKTTYLAAEKPYLDGDSNKAIKQFRVYLKEFPNGLQALKANFYLAELYYKKDDFENSKTYYTNVINSINNEFTEQSLVKLSEIYLMRTNWEEAKPVLLRLEDEADFPQNKLYAQSNLMKAYYETQDYEKANIYAQNILSVKQVDIKIKSDAQIIIARSAIKTNNETKAREAYRVLENIATGKIAAEALYYKAYFLNKDSNFEASNETIQQLAKDYSSYKYYSAKGLVVMAKNFYELEDAFQATYILESVITNFTEFKDVIDEANIELNNIKTKESETNASVETSNN